MVKAASRVPAATAATVVTEVDSRVGPGGNGAGGGPGGNGGFGGNAGNGGKGGPGGLAKGGAIYVTGGQLTLAGVTNTGDSVDRRSWEGRRRGSRQTRFRPSRRRSAEQAGGDTRPRKGPHGMAGIVGFFGTKGNDGSAGVPGTSGSAGAAIISGDRRLRHDANAPARRHGCATAHGRRGTAIRDDGRRRRQPGTRRFRVQWHDLGQAHGESRRCHIWWYDHGDRIRRNRCFLRPHSE